MILVNSSIHHQIKPFTAGLFSPEWATLNQIDLEPLKDESSDELVQLAAPKLIQKT